VVRGAGQRGLAVAAAGAVALILQFGAASAFPGANGKVVFVRGGTITTAEASGSGVTSLVSGANPMWSPSGAQIAYDSGGAIRTVNADGTGDAAVSGAAGTDPAWNPTGTQIAFNDGSGISYVPAGGGTATEVTTSGGEPAWSPDGTSIAYTDGGNIHVKVVGGGDSTLTGSGGDSDPTWSPDGSRIGFVRGGDVYFMNVDGSLETRLTETASAESNPSWSPDGTLIAVSKDSGIRYINVENGAEFGGATATGSGDVTPDWGTAFANLTPPAISPSGAKKDGDVITVSNGTWSVPIASFTYQWKRCDSAGGSCIDIPGGTNQDYTVSSADVSFTLRAAVTASNGNGSQTATTAATSVVTGVAPVNTVAPSITGATTPTVGISMTASPGTWIGTQTIVFAYQWQSCTSATDLSTCSDISGATNPSYAPVAGDAGKFIRVEVTGTNSLGSGTEFSPVTSAAVVSNLPTNTVLPLITVPAAGPRSGSILTTTTGTWTGASFITFTYQWRRCDSNGANCSNIANAIFSSYTLRDADVGSRIRVDVTGKNSFGSTTASSEPTVRVEGIAPTNTSRPTINGVARAGQLLNVTSGTWSGTQPLVFTYQWRRCNAQGGSCVAIAGATATSYVLTSADVGSVIIVFVTASGPSGTATVSSDQTAVVSAGNVAAATKPNNTRVPVITGVTAKGKRLSASAGTWTGTTPMTFSYQWQRCPRTTLDCKPIALATRSTYVAVQADLNNRLRVLVTAGNAAGSTSATTAPTKVITLKAPAAPKGKKGKKATKGKTIRGNARANRLFGTNFADTIFGGGGNDTINPRKGRDRVFAGAGNDTINSVDGARDVIDCGPGRRDRVSADRVGVDRVKRNCERITRRR
jgi:dipeptidyl aminopeptidase/acylaminoacyl peptidase